MSYTYVELTHVMHEVPGGQVMFLAQGNEVTRPPHRRNYRNYQDTVNLIFLLLAGGPAIPYSSNIRSQVE